jgi:hypothetical protein
MLTDLEAALVRVQVTELIGLYVHHMDRGKSDDVAHLFAADGGTWQIMGDGFDRGTFTGRDAIVSHMERMKTASAGDQSPWLRHHVASIRVWVDDAPAVGADCYFTAYTDRGPDHWGRYKDRVVFEDARWRFEHRAVIHEGRVVGGWLDRQDRRAHEI